MTGWILILTLLRYQAASITQVGPFQTEAACMSAAKAWLDQQGTSDQALFFSRRALCVKQS